MLFRSLPRPCSVGECYGVKYQTHQRRSRPPPWRGGKPAWRLNANFLSSSPGFGLEAAGFGLHGPRPRGQFTKLERGVFGLAQHAAHDIGEDEDFLMARRARRVLSDPFADAE